MGMGHNKGGFNSDDGSDNSGDEITRNTTPSMKERFSEAVKMGHNKGGVNSDDGSDNSGDEITRNTTPSMKERFSEAVKMGHNKGGFNSDDGSDNSGASGEEVTVPKLESGPEDGKLDDNSGAVDDDGNDEPDLDGRAPIASME